ncbi:MAG: choice-of-anchor B family protein [Bacteroidetes bacterium]|nr:choice-of-anchor B family protein [Bacteroidota bacterium]
MRKFTSVLLLLLFLFLNFSYNFGQSFKNCRLLDNWRSDTILTNSTKVRFSGCWGFIQNGKEYAVIGSTEGHHFFQLTEADSFQFIQFIPGRYVSSQAITREYKNYSNYLYATGDEGDGSLQIIDLSFLPDSVSLVQDIQNSEIGKIHNIFIDTANDLLYACSVTPFLNGQELNLVPLKVFSLQDPLNPSLVWQGPEDLFEVHDIFVRENLAILNCGYEGIRIYDFSQPDQPIYKSNLSIYQDQGYNHQGWLCPDNKTYIFADETSGTKIKKALLNPDFSLTVNHLFGTENEPYDKTAHNIHCTNEFAFVAYYNDGLRIFDLRSNPPLEIAFYDTHEDEPENIFSMWGAWGIYAFLPSNRILVSDRISGLFMFDFDRELFLKSPPKEEIVIFPNPCSSDESCIFSIPHEAKNPQLRIIDMFGKVIWSTNFTNTSIVTFEKNLSSGMYCVQFEFTNYMNEQETQLKKLIIE